MAAKRRRRTSRRPLPRLDLDHRRPLVGEVAGGERRRGTGAELENVQAGVNSSAGRGNAFRARRGEPARGVEVANGGIQRRLLLVRVAQTQFDDRFQKLESVEPLVTPAE